MSGYSLWRQDRERARKLFLEGEPCEVRGSEYLGNDFLIESFGELGYWELLASPMPDLGREDVAIPAEALNRLWVIKELAGCGHVSEAGKLLSDGHVMARAGFNVESIREKAMQGNGCPVISLRSLYRHARRVPQSQTERVLLDGTRLLRQNKWLRGGVYAADCYDIPVSGVKMEGIYENTDQDKVRGYKLLVISNVTEGREFAVAAVLGGICDDERDLLIRALKSLANVCPPKEMIRMLLLDRGYWKARTLWEVKHVWGIPFLTLAKHDLDLTQEAILKASEPTDKEAEKNGGRNDRRKKRREEELRQLRRKIENLSGKEARKAWKALVSQVLEKATQDGRGSWRTLERISLHSGKKYDYRLRAVPEVPLKGYSEDGKSMGSVNCVLGYRGEHFAKDRKQVVYVTSEAVEGQEETIVNQYRERWSIENAIMKFLSEHDARKINGWTCNAAQYRLFLLLHLRNAMTLVHWKYPQEAAVMKRLLAQRKRRSYLEGHGAIIYTYQGVYGTFPTREAMEMAEHRGVRRTVKAIKHSLGAELPGLLSDKGSSGGKDLLATIEEVLTKKK